MAGTKIATQENKLTSPAEVAISLGLFLLALLPRAYDLQRFVTADEAKWVYRSARFLAALLRGDLPATSVNLTPAVTTTWLGSLGLALYYRLNQAVIDLPFNDWLLSLPEFRADLPLLVATRWPMVFVTSLSVVLIYLLARRLFDPTVALIGAALLALDPHTIALSRILGHDAPVTMFMTISVLLLLVYNHSGEQAETRSPSALLLLGSGLAAGLAFLSKSPAFFLIPFAGLVFLGRAWLVERREKPDSEYAGLPGAKRSFPHRLYFWTRQFLVWLSAAYLTFILLWPAAWAEPIRQPLAVIENAFLSATDQEEADSEKFWLVPNLGPLYYIVNGAFKLSPLVTIGLALALIPVAKEQLRPRSGQPAGDGKALPDKDPEPASSPRPNPKLALERSEGSKVQSPTSNIGLLLAFVLLFTLFMTLGGKRSPRYILPIFPALALLSAFGWVSLSQMVRDRWLGTAFGSGSVPLADGRTLPPSLSRIFLPILIILLGLLFLLPYAPYYFTYFNPLVGGSYTAPYLVKIGWGEGLDQVGRFIQREFGNVRIGTAYASTVSPFFSGDISNPGGEALDYVVFYRKQLQSGEPSPAVIRYFEQNDAIFSVKLNGISYADVYPGPAAQSALVSASDTGAQPSPQPVGFRPLTAYGQIGGSLDVDVLWPGDVHGSADTVSLTLEPLAALDPANAEEGAILAEGLGQLRRLADELIISRHTLPLSNELERGRYALLVDDRPLGEIELRRFQRPAGLLSVDDTLFENQIALIGYQFGPTADYIAVNLVWQAQKSHLPDYTVFVQLIDVESNQRVAGVDSRPVQGEWPTSQWIKREVVVDKYFVAVPYQMPDGFYQIIVGLYQPDTGQRLILNNGQDHWLLPWTFIRGD